MKPDIIICGPISNSSLVVLRENVLALQTLHRHFEASGKYRIVRSPYGLLMQHNWIENVVEAERKFRLMLVKEMLQDLIQSDQVAFRVGWRKSYGCLLEYCVAVNIGLAIFETTDGGVLTELKPEILPYPIDTI